jgi:hypothetical protein
MKLVARLFLLLATLAMSTPICAQETPAGKVVWGYQSGETLTDLCRASLQMSEIIGKTLDQAGRTFQEIQQIYFDAGLCEGYVLGVVDLIESQGGQTFKTNSVGPICLPLPNISRNTLIEVVARYVDQNPAVRHFGGAGLVMMALANAFPCKGERGARQEYRLQTQSPPAAIAPPVGVFSPAPGPPANVMPQGPEPTITTVPTRVVPPSGGGSTPAK